MQLLPQRVLPEPLWRARAAAHEQRVDRWLAPHLDRRRAGRAHPVEDFLFTYYAHSPAALRRWHPGYGVALEGSADHGGLNAYAGSPPSVSSAYLDTRLQRVHATHTLLEATASRPPQLGCFGLHEWAMVYRTPADRVRHGTWPLRLGSRATDAVVESHRIGCSHFDAYRFFSPEAVTRNTLRPARDDRADFEQPGCLHAGMDLYKHAFRLSPLIASELVADCFELARDIRVLDMRASPYDLSELGYAPVRIETPQGKQEYVAAQRAFMRRATPLRGRLIEECERLLAAAG